ncbi:MAG: Asp-tRNA(Asn)/Glu-tRNA(Gln) amidotransferase subunit GatA [Puniceicoccales bacterium]|jgi:aspartyl-tRNA(Asn)/glutamyl-tRNA(Gln) amidotransferase subunit A|nr:Asp-tRNA(Asn)/Glu-tRNA(Gln) amidotransferase subunit GatA [Puniceicoccales bacterium]
MGEEIYYYQSLKQIVSAFRNHAITPVELMEALINRIKKTEPLIHSFISYDVDSAMEQAIAATRRWQMGENRSSFDGIPIGIKDIISVRGQPLTCGSRMLGNYVSPYDATVIKKLRSAGMVIFGRLNLDEFAMGSSTENSAFGPTMNPWNLRCVPGGSSGGSASAVASGQMLVSLGTDTGGSIRQPAAFCGVVGLKPTYGRVSRYGMAAFASSLDQIGPLGRSVEDVAIILSIISGRDIHDSTSIDLPVADYEQQSREERPWRIGIVEEFMGDGMDDSVRQVLQEAIEFYKSSGCDVISLSLSTLKAGLAAYYVIATAEAFSNLARFDGIRYGHRSAEASDAMDIYAKSRAEGFGAEVKRRIILGAFVLHGGYHDAYYTRAQKVRSLIREDYEKALKNVDFLLSPTTPTVAFPLGMQYTDPLQMYLNDIYTVTVNLAGLPAISMPCGFDSNHMPIGLQLIGKPYEEGALLSAARFFEKSHKFASGRPSFPGSGYANENSYSRRK